MYHYLALLLNSFPIYLSSLPSSNLLVVVQSSPFQDGGRYHIETASVMKGLSVLLTNITNFVSDD